MSVNVGIQVSLKNKLTNLTKQIFLISYHFGRFSFSLEDEF